MHLVAFSCAHYVQVVYSKARKSKHKKNWGLWMLLHERALVKCDNCVVLCLYLCKLILAAILSWSVIYLCFLYRGILFIVEGF